MDKTLNVVCQRVIPTGRCENRCVSVCVLQIEQVSQLAALVQAQLEYHRRSAEILQQLSSKIEDRYGSTCERLRRSDVP